MFEEPSAILCRGKRTLGAQISPEEILRFFGLVREKHVFVQVARTTIVYNNPTSQQAETTNPKLRTSPETRRSLGPCKAASKSHKHAESSVSLWRLRPRGLQTSNEAFFSTSQKQSEVLQLIRVPVVFFVDYFSRGTLPRIRVKGHYWRTLNMRTEWERNWNCLGLTI